jgi:hypothetical protein
MSMLIKLSGIELQGPDDDGDIKLSLNLPNSSFNWIYPSDIKPLIQFLTDAKEINDNRTTPKHDYVPLRAILSDPKNSTSLRLEDLYVRVREADVCNDS